ncbi:MAG: Alanine racemase 2 [Chroococcopsis gigantea SAG 12.99]|jgi:alanine racemase|nr:alanine racemase [Chlorogloea purpurea SAG 13.99]MDV3000753.1 Alanine racemase 2 [Chroococcopsis gigantea SAG 12.99]
MVLSEEVRVRSEYNYQRSQIIRHRAWVEIDRSALAHNITAIKNHLSPRTELMAVVKADGYGHGAAMIARTALESGAGSLAIATLSEGIQLREEGITAPVLVLGAINTPEEIAAAAHWQLQPTLCSLEQAQIMGLTMTELQRTLPVHLKLDTGMSRLGTLWGQATDFVKQVVSLPYLKIHSVYSHLATADDEDTAVMKLQQARFEGAIAEMKKLGFTPPCLHLANSAATLRDRSMHYDRVRVGLAMYGLYPAGHLQSTLSLKPVLAVKARITQVKELPAGTGVSYGHQYVTPKAITMAVVGIGYADGVPRNLSGRMEVIVRGRKVPQIGAITMDQLMIDISGMSDISAGEIVTLIGYDGGVVIGAEDWAASLNTISWEILCGFKHRLPRITVS